MQKSNELLQSENKKTIKKWSVYIYKSLKKTTTKKNKTKKKQQHTHIKKTKTKRILILRDIFLLIVFLEYIDKDKLKILKEI